MSKSVSDEAICAALISTGSIAEAAKVAGCTGRTVYARLQERSFVEMYESAKNDLLRTAVFAAGRKVQTAVDTIAEIMETETNGPKVRLQAAQIILNDAVRFSSLLSQAEYEARQKQGDPLDPMITFNNDF